MAENSILLGSDRWRRRIEIMKQHKHDYITISFEEVELALAVVDAAKEAVPHLDRYHGIDEHNLRRAVAAFEAMS